MNAGEPSLHGAAEAAPDAVALLTRDEIHTYAQLSERVRSLESELRTAGVVAGQATPVALLAAPNSVTVFAFWALVELGVPCALIDPRLAPDARGERVLAARAMLTLDTTSGSVVIISGRPPVEDPEPATATSPESVLAIVFTSGSSGAPKGVKLSRRAFAASAAASAERLGRAPDDRWYVSLPLSHVGGLSILIRSALARTAVVLHDPAAGSAGDPVALANGIERNDATVVSVVPTQLRRMLAAERDHTWRRLRIVLVGGAAVPVALLSECRKRGIHAVASYGLTEACSQVATQDPFALRAGTASLDGAPPLPGVAVRVRAGVVEVSGATLFSGYLAPHDADGPASDGWFTTTELGTFEDGLLRIHGRRSELIVTGGENVYPTEVEAFLESLEIISVACVFSVPDPEWGEIVCAAVVEAEHSSKTASLLLAELIRSGLAPHQRPRQIAWLPSLPLNQTGKLDRLAVRKLAEGALRPLPAR